MSILRLSPPKYEMTMDAEGEYVSAQDALKLIEGLHAIATADYAKISQAELGNMARRALNSVGE